MSFSFAYVGHVPAVTRAVDEAAIHGEPALPMEVRAFLRQALPIFDNGEPDTGVDVAASGHVDHYSGQLTVSVKRVRLALGASDEKKAVPTA